ncbi:MAG: PhnD/SsuA/transferrin family substrate-binding protein [Archangium sp.]|nr:PhnD/SsuA/transferrin family substrate-binding protein [Archangium sp.]MDP3151595.1 PhnD/SsuA/transferrin family substrate-binding protein [Archangium sp.]MDP3569130.1 PhnD/SsuA/transferrin family substrate-binding protein [Archangium sp.]
MSTKAPRTHVRFAIPSSLGNEVGGRAQQLQAHLTAALGRETEVVQPATYEQLARELLSGKVDAAWAPPFVCARIEAMGVRVLVRGVRDGASAYRAALLTRKDSNLTLDTLKGTTAAWSDRDSVGGFLLPMAFLRDRGLDPMKTFAQQDFLGNYRNALEAVLEGKADVTSVFAPAAKAGTTATTGLAQMWPEKENSFRVLGFTEEAPNDGVAVSMGAGSATVTELEKMLLSMHSTPEGAAVLKDCFHADKFELAPRMGYRALYRVALASL